MRARRLPFGAFLLVPVFAVGLPVGVAALAAAYLHWGVVLHRRLRRPPEARE